MTQNPGNNYLINLDKPATIDCFSKINGADEINKKPVVYVGTNIKNKNETDQKNIEFRLYAELENPFNLSTSKKPILIFIL